MRRNLIASVCGVVALASSSPVRADGLLLSSASVPSYQHNWAGPYIGVGLGGSWSSDTVTPTVADGGTFPRTNSLSANAKLNFSGRVGYNFQYDNFVAGVEGDVGRLSISGSGRDALGGTEIDQLNGGLYGDVTGRLGYSLGSILLYGKGGFAFFDGNAFTTTGIPGFTIGKTSTFTGWTAGGGAELKLSENFSVNAEYSHFDFGSENATLTSGAGVFPYKNDLTVDIFRVGINLRFNSFPGRDSAPLK